MFSERIGEREVTVTIKIDATTTSTAPPPLRKENTMTKKKSSNKFKDNLLQSEKQSGQPASIEKPVNKVS